VLDVEEAASVLRLGADRVRDLTADPHDPEQLEDPELLHRLAYSRVFLYDAREVRRFARAWSRVSPLSALRDSQPA
jgi:hypothetical protein